MRAHVRVEGGLNQQVEFQSLHEWLRREDELRGLVSVDRPPIRSGEMGALSDTLVVSVSSAGAITVLARSLSVWLRQRRSDVKITVDADGSVTVDAKRAPDAEALVRKVLEHRDGGPSDGG
ncbi:hypothetical protein GCM10010470_14630 [Saccharopolyspora taberi]|uniref:Uncharacterized protein n=1 Tax=Saccharopolyspora taberi TaxID=60895 RepID=A0ABN3V9K4_9PSEU